MALTDERARGEHITDLGEQIRVAHRTQWSWTPPKRLRDAPPAACLTRRRTGHASHPAHHSKWCGQLLAHAERLGNTGCSLRSNSALTMSSSIESSPTLRCASRNAKSSTGSGRAFNPPPASRQELLTPAADPPSGLTALTRQQIQGLATQQTHDNPLLAPGTPARFALAYGSLLNALDILLRSIHTGLRNSRHADLLGLNECPVRTGCEGGRRRPLDRRLQRRRDGFSSAARIATRRTTSLWQMSLATSVAPRWPGDQREPERQDSHAVESPARARSVRERVLQERRELRGAELPAGA